MNIDFWLIFLVSFLVSFFSTKELIPKFKKRGIVVRDMYKKGRPKIPTLGGIAILFGIIAGLIISQLLLEDVTTLLIFHLVVMNFAIFTLVDDFIDIGRKIKVIVPFFLALPIALLNIDTTLSLYFFEIELGVIYAYIIAPLYVMVVANLINMHSGFNGLAMGLSLILLLTIFAKVVMKGSNPVYLIPVLSSLFGFFLFNKYPSKIFEGNIGAFTVGSAIGGLLILYNIEFFGVVILLPHIINFLMYVYWRLRKYPFKKFGSIRSDGTLRVPNNLTLKWVFPYYFRLTEKQVICLMYFLTTVFCILGLIFF